MQKIRVMGLSAMALGVLLSAGCGTSTTNDENVTSTPAAGGAGTPVKSYGEMIERQRAKEAATKSEANASSKAQPKRP
jgi:hypothetical protein